MLLSAVLCVVQAILTIYDIGVLMRSMVGSLLAPFGFMGLFLGPTLLAVAYSLLEDWLVKEVPGIVVPAKRPSDQLEDAAVRD